MQLYVPFIVPLRTATRSTGGSGDQALYAGSVLPRQLIEQSFAYHQLASGDTVHYGYGWHLKKNGRGEQVVYHTGSSTSFRNVFYRIPSRRLSIILLTNRNQPAEEDMVTLAERIAASLPPIDFSVHPGNAGREPFL
ncbi:serine hydrolase [Parapedobacter sp. 2B3]|uniref:serine hydrolase n=1 Tax=Parapedobacter sp. 2B3 TaxID=3342381 RepID=UPI0035B5DE9B